MSWLGKGSGTGRKGNEIADHSYVQERLSAYLDGQLSASEKRALQRHLASCSSCQWHLDTLRQTIQWTQELPKVPLPRAFTVPAPSEPVPAPRRPRSLIPLLQGATALIALLLVVVVAGDFMLVGTVPTQAPWPSEVVAGPTAVVEMAQEMAAAEVEPVPEAEGLGGAEPAVEEAPVEPVEAPAPAATMLVEAPTTDVEAEQEVEQALPAEVSPSDASQPEAMMESAVGPTPVPGPERMTVKGQKLATDELPVAPEEGATQDEAPPGEPAEMMMLEQVVTEAAPADTPEVEAEVAITEPTLDVTPLSQRVEPTAVAEPTAFAEVQPSVSLVVDDELPRSARARGVLALLQPSLIWLRAAECSLGILLLVLAAMTVSAMVRRRRAK